MQIARELAGYSLGGADLLRRAMGKKKVEEMAKHRAVFVQGAVERGVTEETAHYIFDLMEKFAGYGFNKSHSAAYAWVSYQTAWLKAHHPEAFMAAVLSSDMDNTDKLVGFVEECRLLGLSLEPPDVNRSEYRFTVLKNRSILYGLGAIKGMGQAAIEDILSTRQREGVFRDIHDFCRRVDLRKANRRVLEALIRAGAMDALGAHRAQLMADLPSALQAAEQYHRSLAQGQNDLFGLGSEDAVTDLALPPTRPSDPWSNGQRLAEEKMVLGLYLSGHPMDEHREELKFIAKGTLESLTNKFQHKGSENLQAVVAGLVADIRTRQNKQNKKMVFITLEDGTGRLEVAIFPEVLEEFQELLRKENILVIQGELANDAFTGNLRLMAEKIWTVAQARETFAKGLWIHWPARKARHIELTTVANILQAHRGGRCPVYIDYQGERAQACLQLGKAWRIRPDDELLQGLAGQLGKESVQLRYD